jgi:3-phenylpropionate/trans-cinnamate dioxygenase ferredoxin reductase component
MTQTFIVVGAGHAGSRAADCLRRSGFGGRLVLVGDETHLPYQRPPLSKKFLLSADVKLERLLLRTRRLYDAQNVTLNLATRVAEIDRAGRRIKLGDDTDISYDKLLLCLGARPRRLDLPGIELAGIHYLRNLDDAKTIRAEFVRGRRLVVVGAGYIGLELAATARQLGLEVSVIEAADRPLSRVVAPFVSEFFSRCHTRAGVKLHCNTSVRAFSGKIRVQSVATSDGEEIPADIVVIGVGITPETALAGAAGLACDNGIVVDDTCRTSDPAIYAAGDCTRHSSVHYGRRVRLESVDNALEQARIAAACMCGIKARHEQVPWFWSDQYDLKLLIAGLSEGYEETIVRGEPAGGRFSVWYLRSGELLAVDAINCPGDFMQGRKWIGERKRPDTRKLADTGFELAAI